MARVFTIDFHFAESDCFAFVSIISNVNARTTYHVQIYDENLHVIIPDGKLVLCMENGVIAPHKLKHPLAKDLILSISNSIAKHIKYVNY